MNTLEHRRLGILSLTALLVSAHYGLGFLLGTAEKAYAIGSAGSLYAVSIGLGTLALLLLAKLYWQEVEQIWTLLGDRYGTQVKALIGVMSWTSLIGIEAAQIISGSFILKVLGVSLLPGMIGLVILFLCLSLLSVDRVSWIFRGLLILNLLALVYCLWVLHGIPTYLHMPLGFVSSLHQLTLVDLISIIIPTLLLVLIDMKYQQFVIQARDLRSLYIACTLAGGVLLLLALLPSAVVEVAAQTGILPPDLDGKETIPYILSWVGGGVGQPLGILLLLALVIPALGVGSNVLRIQTKTILDLNIVPRSPTNQILVTGVNALLGLAIALRGGSIVGLIVCFYAVYVAAAWIPFLAFLLDRARIAELSAASVRLGLSTGSLGAVTALGVSLSFPNQLIWNSPELTILLMGFGAGSLGMILKQLSERLGEAVATKAQPQPAEDLSPSSTDPVSKL